MGCNESKSTLPIILIPLEKSGIKSRKLTLIEQIIESYNPQTISKSSYSYIFFKKDINYTYMMTVNVLSNYDIYCKYTITRNVHPTIQVLSQTNIIKNAADDIIKQHFFKNINRFGMEP